MHEQDFFLDDSETDLLLSLDPSENFWDSIDEDDEDSDSSSASFDFDSKDPNITNNSKYWSPVKEGDMGPFGNAEMRMASANFFEEGDVGNDIWLREREIAFGDYGDSMIGVTANAMMLFGFETHPELVRYPDPDINSNYMKNDPALRWAMEEYNATQDPRRKELLATFMAEAQSFNERIVQDMFVSVPDWAIDPLHHAMEVGLQYDPQLVPESGEPSALKTRPVSVVPLPSQLDVKRYYNIQDPVQIQARNTREWTIALVDGVKTMGPYGERMGTIHMLQPSNPEDGKEVKAHRVETLAEMLHSHHFQLTIESSEDGPVYTANYVGDTELESMEAAYGKMAKDISQVAAFNSALLTYRDTLMKELRRDAFIEIAKSMKHDATTTIAQLLLEETGHKHIGQVTWKEVKKALAPATVSDLLGQINKKVDMPTFILEVRQQWGWETVAITKDSELAAEWKTAQARDIPYFLGKTGERRKNARPTSFIPGDYEDLGEAMKAHVDYEVDQATSEWIDRSYIGNDNLKRLINQFNAGHRVKKIPAREARYTSWLMNEMPLTQDQLRVAREALASLGQRIVKQRIANAPPAQRIAFRKLQKALESRLDRWTPDDKDLTLEALRNVSKGSVDIMFSYTERDLPNQKDWNSFLKAGFVFPEEAHRGKMVVPSIKFNHVFNDHAEVFSICKNFHPRDDLKRKAKAIVDRFTASNS